MEFLTSLWLPILLSGVAVFIVSSIIHMLLPYHKTDFTGLPLEDDFLSFLREKDTPAGEYVFPHAGSTEAMKSEVYIATCKQGPVGFVTILPGGGFAMGPSLAMWFVYGLVVSLFTAYVTDLALAPGAPYMAVHRIAGTVAFIGYSLALLQNSIWYKRKWSSTLKSMFDGLIYGLVTGGVFGWLWPA